ncbi:MAG: hypothetical protein ACFFBX_01450 [Promethearchaeota archaeon]
MSKPDQSSQSYFSTALGTNMKSIVKESDWLASTPFGDGLKRSIYLLQRQFRWYVFLFFFGGVILAITVFPINSIIAGLEYLLVLEMLAPIPDILNLVNLLIISQILGLLVNFFTFFGFFLLSTITIYHAIRSEKSLHLLVKAQAPVHFPTLQVIGVGLATAAIFTTVSVILFLIPFIQVLFFFIPVVLIIENQSIGKAFSQSFQLRRRYWHRILGALILGYLFMLFAGRLGVTIYLSIDAVFNLVGVPLGLVGPFLLILINQLFVAMIAPILPLLSVAFYGGAKNTQHKIRYEAYIKWVQKQKIRYPPISTKN